MTQNRIRANFARVATWLLAVLLVAGCGGGGGGGGGSGGSSLANLQGTWQGTYQVEDAGYGLTVVIGSNGQITDVRQWGTSLGITGTIQHEQGNIYSFTLSDGTEGGFMTDASGTHAGFLTNAGDFGVLQKGVSSTPTYAIGDIIDNWAGYSVMLDSGFDVAATGSSSAVVTLGGTALAELSGSDMNGPFAGDVTFVNSGLGVFAGEWSAGSDSGNFIAWMSNDKTFAATWACSGNVLWPAAYTDCTFAIWNRQ